MILILIAVCFTAFLVYRSYTRRKNEKKIEGSKLRILAHTRCFRNARFSNTLGSTEIL